MFGTAGDERGAANVGREGVSHDLIAPGVLQTSDALDGVAFSPGESHLSFRIATGHIDGAEEILGHLPGFGIVARDKRNAGFGATMG